VFSFRDALHFVFAMDTDRDLCGAGGLSEANVAKLDIAKLTKPKEWGWRFLAFDFIMPNHQIVECYIVSAAQASLVVGTHARTHARWLLSWPMH
jgi:hypothetical protein